MYVDESFAAMNNSVVVGFTLLLISMLCLGSWPAFLRLSSSSLKGLPAWLGRTNRDMRFAYLDYAISYVVSSSIPLVLALLLSKQKGESGDSSSSSSWPLIGFALAGGSLLSLGNMSMQWATTVLGAPLTTVVALQASLCVVLGTSINFLLQPEKTTHPHWLLAGVATFLVAIALATRAQMLYSQEQAKRQNQGYDSFSEGGIEFQLETTGKNDKSTDDIPTKARHSYGSLESNDSLESNASLESSPQNQHVLVVDTTVDSTVVRSASQNSPNLASLVATMGGLCFGFFSPAFNVAINDPFDWTRGNALSVPVANLWFSLSFTTASFVGHIPLLHHPPRPFGLQPATFADYWSDAPLVQRTLPILAGVLCGAGNLLQFQGGNMVGFATADLVQAFPLVSTLWDYAVFGEFKRARTAVVVSLVAMYLAYVSGIGFLMASVSR